VRGAGAGIRRRSGGLGALFYLLATGEHVFCFGPRPWVSGFYDCYRHRFTRSWPCGMPSREAQVLRRLLNEDALMASPGARRSRTPPAAADAKAIVKGARGVSGRSNPQLRALQSLRTIFGAARAHDTEVRRTSGLSGSKLWALSEIASRRGITVNELASRMALHQTSASNLVNALVEDKLIIRMRDARDRRVIHLHPSVEGQKMLLRTPGPHAGLLVDALRKLEIGQIQRLRQSLVLLTSVMQRAAEDSAGDPLMGE